MEENILFVDGAGFFREIPLYHGHPNLAKYNTRIK